MELASAEMDSLWMKLHVQSVDRRVLHVEAAHLAVRALPITNLEIHYVLSAQVMSIYKETNVKLVAKAASSAKQLLINVSYVTAMPHLQMLANVNATVDSSTIKILNNAPGARLHAKHVIVRTLARPAHSISN